MNDDVVFAQDCVQFCIAGEVEPDDLQPAADGDFHKLRVLRQRRRVMLSPQVTRQPIGTVLRYDIRALRNNYRMAKYQVDVQREKHAL